MGFNFNKISVRKENIHLPKDFKINTNIDVSEIKTAKSDILKTKEEIVAVTFTFVVEYSPDFAKIELEGNLVFAIEPNLSKEIIKQWEDKKIHEEFRTSLFNIILKKANIKALELEEEMNLPIHVPLPTVREDSGQ